MYIVTLNKVTVKQLEDYWINHKDYKKQLYYRELEVLHPYREADSNIGGGKSNRTSDTTMVKAAALVEDARYQHLKKVVRVVEDIYEELDDDQRTIVDMRYFDKDECYEWEDIADKLFMSRQRVFRKRNRIIDKTAERLGWL